MKKMQSSKQLNLSKLMSITFVIFISGCNNNLNFSQYIELPKNLYQSMVVKDPAPKETGIINFKTYAIVRAKKGERVYNVADRINVSSRKIAVHNGLSENYQLSQGEILAIPLDALPDKNDNSINIAKVASEAINNVKNKQEVQAKEEIKQVDENNSSELKNTNNTESTIVIDELIAKPYIKPIEGEISSPFSYDTSGNQGINIKGVEGTPVKATNDGTIVLVSRGANQPTVVLIRHDSEILSAYSNISEVNLSKNDKVTKGQIIGVISKGADHLHFEIIKGSERIDPIGFIESN